MKTKVIFRKWKESGDIIAFFPEEPGNWNATTCNSYEHYGQHGSASLDIVNDRKFTVPATPDEYADLKAELERIGYDLDIRQRYTYAMQQARFAELQRVRAAM